MPTVGVATLDGQQRVTLTFTPQVVSGLRYRVEVSSDLQDWSAQMDVTALLTAGQPFVFQDSVSLATANRRFLRLRVVLQP